MKTKEDTYIEKGELGLAIGIRVADLAVLALGVGGSVGKRVEPN